MEWRKDDYLITDDPSKVQLDVVHRLLAATYWGGRRPREIVERMVAGSICFSLYRGPTQIGFGRAVTDSATFTWVADIVVEPEFRGIGLGTWIMKCLLEHPATKGTQMVLQTRDAHGLYERFGFSGNSALMSTGVTDL
ncbi:MULTISPECIES: GNAT family N-acetyltransferase [unclassified Marinobacter]|uniref:GNAT family N-acetyltransferase n=1 Tax=unclassified Marinobacter TaxID=83889 RepID=UPI001268BB31|nr:MULTISPECIES: GNAT family N-acetyltransferase [unclassified Marinobacter]QFS87425.1 Acetyltransferase (GNAT) family protein [Marinobacter sp. THAF197a]QFT51209.1 Acetyltransferase (GNAT) family protein [Marinobacter sp. THAF39]